MWITRPPAVRWSPNSEILPSLYHKMAVFESRSTQLRLWPKKPISENGELFGGGILSKCAWESLSLGISQLVKTHCFPLGEHLMNHSASYGKKNIFSTVMNSNKVLLCMLWLMPEKLDFLKKIKRSKFCVRLIFGSSRLLNPLVFCSEDSRLWQWYTEKANTDDENTVWNLLSFNKLT